MNETLSSYKHFLFYLKENDNTEINCLKYPYIVQELLEFA